MVVAAVGVHCIVFPAVVDAAVARLRPPPPAHSTPDSAADSVVLLLGRVGQRAPREQRVGQVSDEGNLERIFLLWVSCFKISIKST